MPLLLDQQDLEHRMYGVIKIFQNKIASVHDGRPSPQLLDNIKVDAYGKLITIRQLSNITVTDAQQLTIQVWDTNLINSVEKAIRDSDLDLNPQNVSGIIRVEIPSLTEERRKKYIALVNRYAEDTKINIRKVRRYGIDKLKIAEKSGGVSKDTVRSEIESIQKLTDKYITKIDLLLVNKVQDLKMV